MTHAHARFVERSVLCARDPTGVRVHSPPGASPSWSSSNRHRFSRAARVARYVRWSERGAGPEWNSRARRSHTAGRWAATVRGTRDWRPALLPPPVRLTWNCITPGATAADGFSPEQVIGRYYNVHEKKKRNCAPRGRGTRPEWRRYNIVSLHRRTWAERRSTRLM